MVNLARRSLATVSLALHNKAATVSRKAVTASRKADTASRNRPSRVTVNRRRRVHRPATVSLRARSLATVNRVRSLATVSRLDTVSLLRGQRLADTANLRGDSPAMVSRLVSLAMVSRLASPASVSSRRRAASAVRCKVRSAPCSKACKAYPGWASARLPAGRDRRSAMP